jgi:glycosyltransferase involved in cell wall biosynthesis
MTGTPGRRRILHVIQNLNYGGMERVLADLVRLCDPARFACDVVALQYLGRFATGLAAHAQLHQCPPLGAWSFVRPAPLIRLMRAIGPDVVHSHSGVWHKASLAARRAGVPRVIHTEHGLPPVETWMTRAVERGAARRTSVVVAVSEPLAVRLRARIARPETVRVIPNGVDTTAFRPRPDDGGLRRELGLDPRAPVIGSIGRLEPVKAYEVMVRALAELRATWSADQSSPPVLVIAGDGAERAPLEALARSLGLMAPALHFLGWRDDVHALHAAFTVFSLSSLSEGTSVSLLEAMSAGLCPVVTDVGGNAAVLGAALGHRLVPARDVAGLAAAWRAALLDPAGRARDSAAARRRVEGAYDLRAMVRRYEALYLGEPEPASAR